MRLGNCPARLPEDVDELVAYKTGAMVEHENRRLVATRSTTVISGVEMIENNGVISFTDDFPFWGPLAMSMAPESKAVIEELHQNRHVVTDGISYYVYCESVASWMQLYSEIASRKLLRITGINAPVNYAGPLQETYALAKRIALPIGRLHPSVCVGTYRLVFVIEWRGDGYVIVHYKPHMPVTNSGGRDVMYARIYCFVRSPIILPSPSTCPYRVPISFDDYIINKILMPLRDDQKLDFMFRIGRAYMDPIKDPSVMVLYGKIGHEGKTELAKAISRLMPDAVEWVSEDLFGSKSEWPKVDTVMELCAKRILICDECKIEDGFSYNNVKKWTSQSPISMGGRVGFLSQSAIITSNKIPFYEKSAVNNSIGRRLVVYHMNKNLEKYEPVDPSEITNTVRLRFMSICLSCTASFSHPPVSLPIALYTVFRKNVNRMTAGLAYDVASSSMECIAGTSVMSVRCGVSIKTLCTAFSAISPKLVCKPRYGCTYILSIRTLKRTITHHGIDVVNKRAEANVPKINLDALIERLRVVR